MLTYDDRTILEHKNKIPFILRFALIATGSMLVLKGLASPPISITILEFYNWELFQLFERFIVLEIWPRNRFFDNFKYKYIFYIIFGLLLIVWGSVRTSSELKIYNSELNVFWKYPLWGFSKKYSKSDISEIHIDRSCADSIYSYWLEIRFLDNKVFMSSEFSSRTDVENLKIRVERALRSY